MDGKPASAGFFSAARAVANGRGAGLTGIQSAPARIVDNRQTTNPAIPTKEHTMSRPRFNDAWAASLRIYDRDNSAARVAEVIGGYVAKNINNPNPDQRWKNTCAVRMSYILGEAGLTLPAIRGKTVSGADKRQYFFRVRDLIYFLTRHWGKPEVVDYPASGGGILAGRQGVILFEVSGWDDALGHATLYDGSICYDNCYFNEPGAKYRTDRANFWSLQ